jgi:hypothetical protein
VRRIHAVLHDADPTRWGSLPPPPDRFTDRHDAIADRINAVDWNTLRDPFPICPRFGNIDGVLLISADKPVFLMGWWDGMA